MDQCHSSKAETSGDRFDSVLTPTTNGMGSQLTPQRVMASGRVRLRDKTAHQECVPAISWFTTTFFRRLFVWKIGSAGTIGARSKARFAAESLIVAIQSDLQRCLPG